MSEQPASNPNAAASGAAGLRVRVRMYRPGLGDCFLISFFRAGKEKHVLIDCGVYQGTADSAATMQAIARHIRKTTRRLDLVAATHEHWDHLSGFIQAQDIFNQIEIKQVWLAWTEDPVNPLAAKLRQEYSLALNTLRAALQLMPAEMAVQRRTIGGLLDFFGPPSNTSGGVATECIFGGSLRAYSERRPGLSRQPPRRGSGLLPARRAAAQPGRITGCAFLRARTPDQRNLAQEDRARQKSPGRLWVIRPGGAAQQLFGSCPAGAGRVACQSWNQAGFSIRSTVPGLARACQPGPFLYRAVWFWRGSGTGGGLEAHRPGLAGCNRGAGPAAGPGDQQHQPGFGDRAGGVGASAALPRAMHRWATGCPGRI